MTYEIAATSGPSLLKKIATYVREQYELDLLKHQIRKERKELADLPEDQLTDIGVTRSEAISEAGRKFDDIPERRIRFMLCGC